MRNPTVDHRTLENQLKQASGNEFCTFDNINTVTGMTRIRVMERIKGIAPLDGRPKLYPVRQVAQAIVSWSPKKRKGR